MKKVYYEVHEYDNDYLKNMYYFSYDDILESKRSAERCYKAKITEKEYTGKSLQYQLILTILHDYKTTRYILNDANQEVHQLESQLLSQLTGRTLEVPQWIERENRILQELV